jgi:hypothetical protein
MLKPVSPGKFGNDSIMVKKANGNYESEVLGMLTMTVLNRFLAQINWNDIARMYLSGILSEVDTGLVADALRAITSEGLEFAGEHAVADAHRGNSAALNDSSP